MIPVRASGLLLEFCETGVLVPADVHVALRLARLGNEPSELVQLAAALAVRGVRTGSVCLELATVAESVVPIEAELDDSGPLEEPGAAVPDDRPVELPWPPLDAWLAAVERSPVVAVGRDSAWRPLRFVDGLLYLDRYWRQEELVRRELDQRAARQPPAADLSSLDALFGPQGEPMQRLAATVAASRWVSVITGGPGTGKTHTVARLLKLLLSQPGRAPRIALAAPTGKAAARLKESVQEQAGAIGLPADLDASTLHRLLGWRPDSRSRFKHHAGNHLPYDVVIVDESSMVSLTLMARLLEAVAPTARLVLVGDADQLTSVEAGAVLSDLVQRPAPVTAVATEYPDAAGLVEEARRQLRNGVVRLQVPHRYGERIGALAEAIRTGDADGAVDLLRAGGQRDAGAGAGPGAGARPEAAPQVNLTDSMDELRADIEQSAAQLRSAAAAGDAAGALQLLGRHRLLCGHRR
ncbi:MAG: AAA family ATPase, partial [Actinomycetota bacterium]|nr:AAA family ATPase [Actinomycetota bacterium]